MGKRVAEEKYIQHHNIAELKQTRITASNLLQAIQHCYDTLDLIDEQLLINQTPVLSSTVELANLSSIVGNLLAAGIEKYSLGELRKNKPHTYPDLLYKESQETGVEIKVALEKNKPKGHLPKEGLYLTFRYVLTEYDGTYTKGQNNRGNTVTLWEVKVGYLNIEDFDISDTAGDSGKTATIKTDVLNKKLKLIYFNPGAVPYLHYEHKPYVGYN